MTSSINCEGFVWLLRQTWWPLFGVLHEILNLIFWLAGAAQMIDSPGLSVGQLLGIPVRKYYISVCFQSVAKQFKILGLQASFVAVCTVCGILSIVEFTTKELTAFWCPAQPYKCCSCMHSVRDAQYHGVHHQSGNSILVPSPAIQVL